MLRVRANEQTFRETMCPQQCFLVSGGLKLMHHGVFGHGLSLMKAVTETGKLIPQCTCQELW